MSDTNAAADPADEMPDIYELFQTDPQAEKEGVKVNIGKSWFRIRSADSAAYQAVRTRQIIAQQKIATAGRGVLPDGIVQQNQVELACVACTDWGDVPHPEPKARQSGVVFHFSPQNAKLLFADPRMRKLRDWVLMQAQNFDNFKAASVEALEGNSATASDGSSSEAPPPAA